jgi:hypothetical protein
MKSNFKIPLLKIYSTDVLAQVGEDRHIKSFASYWTPKCPSKTIIKSRVANSWNTV